MNKTAEQLDKEVCASEGLSKALTSPFMKINCVFIISIILISYFFSYKALKTLLKQNIFSNCTRIILFVCSISSIVHQTTMMEIRFLLATGTHFFGFLGVPLAGYVPMCTYPPQLASNFDAINNFRTIIMVLSILIIILILVLSVKVEKKIHENSYNTKTRYTAFENMTTSKSVCLLIILQFSCIMISSYGVTLIRKFEYLIPQEVFHTIVPFLPGVTYANLCLPIVIFYTTKRTIRRRKSKIGELTSTAQDVNSHIKWLNETWS